MFKYHKMYVKYLIWKQVYTTFREIWSNYSLALQIFSGSFLQWLCKEIIHNLTWKMSCNVYKSIMTCSFCSILDCEMCLVNDLCWCMSQETVVFIMAGADSVVACSPVVPFVLCFISIKWYRTLDKIYIWCSFLGSVCVSHY